jgi:hypothetical protein
MAYVDNVLTTLHTAITSTSSTTVEVVKADTSKYNDIPTSGSITIKDSLSNPAKVPETIAYTGLTDNTTYWTLTGVTRAAEGTTANTWLADHIVYQGVTAEKINNFVAAHTHSQAAHAPANADATADAGAVMEADFNAGTFLYAADDNTPVVKTAAEVKAIIGLGSVNNTADSNKPISLATQYSLDQKIGLLLAGRTTAVVDIDNSDTDWSEASPTASADKSGAPHKAVIGTPGYTDGLTGIGTPTTSAKKVRVKVSGTISCATGSNNILIVLVKRSIDNSSNSHQHERIGAVDLKSYPDTRVPLNITAFSTIDMNEDDISFYVAVASQAQNWQFGYHYLDSSENDVNNVTIEVETYKSSSLIDV